MLNLFDLISHTTYTGGKVEPPTKGYRYITAGNGVFISAKNQFVEALVCVSKAEIRGLPSLAPYAKLKHGLLSGILPPIVDHAKKFCNQEVAYHVVWNGDRFDAVVAAYGTSSSIENLRDSPGLVVVELHTHSFMNAYFSKTDNDNQKEFRWFATLGKCNKAVPDIVLRLGVYGYYADFNYSFLFGNDTSVNQASREIKFL